MKVIDSFVDLRFALGALWNGYVVLIHATVFLAGTWLLLPIASRYGSEARAAAHAAGLIGMLMVTLLGWMPIGWWAWMIPAAVAQPLLVIGSASSAAESGSIDTLTRVLAGLYLLWVAGGLLIASRVVIGWLLMSRITRRATPVTDRAWNALLREACTRMKTSQAIELRRSSDVSVPLTWGVLDPVILIPADADGWTDEHRELVLLHELAHVRRADCLLQALSRLALAWYWFHPGAWAAIRGLRTAREESCDVLVLRCGVGRADYAECLMRAADMARRSSSSPAAAVTLAMVRGVGLEKRVRHVLGTRSMRSAPRRLFITTAAAVGAWVLLVGSIRLAPQRSVVWAELESADWQRRAYAASILSRSRFPHIRAELHRRAADDPHPVVRQRVLSTR